MGLSKHGVTATSIIQLCCSMGLSKHGFVHSYPKTKWFICTIKTIILVCTPFWGTSKWAADLAIFCCLANGGFHSGTNKPGVDLSTIGVLFVGYCCFMLVTMKCFDISTHNTMHEPRYEPAQLGCNIGGSPTNKDRHELIDHCSMELDMLLNS